MFFIKESAILVYVYMCVGVGGGYESSIGVCVCVCVCLLRLRAFLLEYSSIVTTTVMDQNNGRFVDSSLALLF